MPHSLHSSSISSKVGICSRYCSSELWSRYFSLRVLKSVSFTRTLPSIGFCPSFMRMVRLMVPSCMQTRMLSLVHLTSHSMEGYPNRAAIRTPERLFSGTRNDSRLIVWLSSESQQPLWANTVG